MAEESLSVEYCYLYVDEAGGPDIFNSKGEKNVGQNGCSRYFFLGMLEVDDPNQLAESLTKLREQLIVDPYFSRAESFKPERKKTAVLLHAKDDLPEVRVKVFDLLRTFRESLRFRAVVCDKEAIHEREVRKRQATPGYRFNPDALYDELARAILTKFSRMADRYRLRIAKRGSKDRNAALKEALEHAEAAFESRFGFSRGGLNAWETWVTNPKEVVCLQAADYFLWALQRFYEPRVHPETNQVTRESRYLDAMWPQISQVYDLHFGPPQGTYFTQQRPLMLDERFGDLPKKRKKPQV